MWQNRPAQAPSSHNTHYTNPSLEGSNNDKTEAPLRYIPELQYCFIIAKYVLRFKCPPYSLNDNHLSDTPFMSQDTTWENGSQIPSAQSTARAPGSAISYSATLFLTPLTLIGSPFWSHSRALVCPTKIHHTKQKDTGPILPARKLISTRNALTTHSSTGCDCQFSS